jgi:uncharacterized membrane protein
MNINLFELVTYFIIYSFLGWIMESIVRSVCERKWINTGFLKGPFCPIYGIGAIIMFLFLEGFENKPILLFCIAIIILTAWEYIVGVLLEIIFHTKYWDYSNHKFNFRGRICLTNSICWGILGVLFVEYIHPYIQSVITKVDSNILNYTVSIFFIVFLVDTITSIIHVKNIKSTLEKIENINKEIKEKLKEIRALKKEKEEKASTTENIQQMVEMLKKKRNKTILRLYKNVYRLKKAFPAINTKEITEILNQKIELRKKRVKNKKKDLK